MMLGRYLFGDGEGGLVGEAEQAKRSNAFLSGLRIRYFGSSDILIFL